MCRVCFLKSCSLKNHISELDRQLFFEDLTNNLVKKLHICINFAFRRLGHKKHVQNDITVFRFGPDRGLKESMLFEKSKNV